MAIKNFVLDTNVLLHDPTAMSNFEDNRVIIPIYVIEEIDAFKKELSERGRNAREVARTLDACRALGRISEGVPYGKGARCGSPSAAAPSPRRCAPRTSPTTTSSPPPSRCATRTPRSAPTW